MLSEHECPCGCSGLFADRGRPETCRGSMRTSGGPVQTSIRRSVLHLDVIGIRGMGYPCSCDPWARCFSDVLVPALCPEHASQRALPLTGRLTSTVSAADINSALFEASSVLCSHPTPHPRACPSYGCCLHGPVRCFGRTRVRSPRFRAKDVSTCMGSTTARGSSFASHCAGRMLLSGQQNGVSTSKLDPFRCSIPSPWSPL